MALKLNIRSDLEEDMEKLLPKAKVRSKTEYINRAIEEFNQKLKRELEVQKLERYFKAYGKEGRAVIREFAEIKSSFH